MDAGGTHYATFRPWRPSLPRAHHLSFPGAGQYILQRPPCRRLLNKAGAQLSSGGRGDRVIKCSSRGVLYSPFIRDRWHGAEGAGHPTHRDQRSHLHSRPSPRVTDRETDFRQNSNKKDHTGKPHMILTTRLTPEHMGSKPMCSIQAPPTGPTMTSNYPPNINSKLGVT